MPFYVVKSPVFGGYITSFNPSRKLARSSTGVLWCCYAEDIVLWGTKQVFVAYSTDNGLTWTVEQVTAEALDQTYPSLAIDSLDNIHLVWRSQRTPPPITEEIYYRQRTALGWGAIEPVTAVADRQDAPNIAVDSLDNVHVVWGGEGWGANPNFTNIQYRQRLAGIWQPQESISDIAFDELWYVGSIAIDAANTVHVVWSGCGWGANPGDYNVQYRQRLAGVWQPREAITDLATWNHMQCIALDSMGNVHVVWYAEPSPGAGGVWQIYYRERIAGVWQATEKLTNKEPLYAQYQPSIAIDSSDDVHIVWYGIGWGVNTGFYNIQYLKRTAGVWGAPVVLTDRAFDQTDSPILIWAFHPVGGGQPNVVDDYLFIFTGQIVPASRRIEFFVPAAPPPPPPSPFSINKAYALSREEL